MACVSEGWVVVEGKRRRSWRRSRSNGDSSGRCARAGRTGCRVEVAGGVAWAGWVEDGSGAVEETTGSVGGRCDAPPRRVDPRPRLPLLVDFEDCPAPTKVACWPSAVPLCPSTLWPLSAPSSSAPSSASIRTNVWLKGPLSDLSFSGFRRRGLGAFAGLAATFADSSGAAVDGPALADPPPSGPGPALPMVTFMPDGRTISRVPANCSVPALCSSADELEFPLAARFPRPGRPLRPRLPESRVSGDDAARLLAARPPEAEETPADASTGPREAAFRAADSPLKVADGAAAVGEAAAWPVSRGLEGSAARNHDMCRVLSGLHLRAGRAHAVPQTPSQIIRSINQTNTAPNSTTKRCLKHVG